MEEKGNWAGFLANTWGQFRLRVTVPLARAQPLSPGTGDGYASGGTVPQVDGKDRCGGVLPLGLG